MKFTLTLQPTYVIGKKNRPIDIPAKEFYKRWETYQYKYGDRFEVNFEINTDNIYTLMDVIKKYRPPYKRGVVTYSGEVTDSDKQDCLQYWYMPASDRVDMKIHYDYPLYKRTNETKVVTIEGKQVVVYRVVATYDHERKGITSEQKGGWIDDKTKIYPNTWIGDESIVIESNINDVTIKGNCVICRSTVDYYSHVKGNVVVLDSTLHEAEVSDNVTIINSTASGNYADNVLLYNVNDSNHDDEHDMYYGTKLCGNEVLAKFDGDKGLEEFLKTYREVKTK